MGLDVDTTLDDDYKVVNELSGVVLSSISAGANYNCGLADVPDTNSNVLCWGRNGVGQLGRGTTGTASPTAAPISAPRSVLFRLVETGQNHACALTEGDQLYCWGNNGSKQVSAGSQGSEPTPIQPALPGGADDISIVSTKGDHTCALRNSGVLQCWGRNNAKQVSSASTADFSPELAVTIAPPIDQTWANVVTGADFSCGVTNNFEVYCWGTNMPGVPSVTVTSPLLTLESPDAISAGGSAVCALDSGGPRCIGNGGLGQLGADAPLQDDIETPVLLTGSHTQLSLNTRYACSLDSEGAASCWGAETGALGVGTVNPGLPREVLPPSGVTGFKDVNVGPNHICAVAEAGASSPLYCWGSGFRNRLGTGDLLSREEPTLVAPGTNFSKVVVAANHSCGLTTNGQVLCWGDNGSLQASPGGPTPTPVVGLPALAFNRLEASDVFTCAAASSMVGDQLYCWGRKAGASSATTEPPNAVTIPQTISSFAARGGHLCYVSGADQLAYCWGENANGEIGSNAPNSIQSPQLVPLPIGVQLTSVQAGANHTCANSSAGAAYCWGQNNVKQASPEAGSIAAPMQAMTPVIATVAPAYAGSTFAITSSGDLLGWGSNANQELLLNDTLGTFPNPTSLPFALDGASNWVQLSSGDDEVCGLTGAGRLFCWGIDGSAALSGQASAIQEQPRMIDEP
jgi:alpha-tubulin suppressor-like RCC1 family protein